MSSIIVDESSPFSLSEHVADCPSGMDASIVRLSQSLGFDATIRMPSAYATGDPDAVISCNTAILHRSFKDLQSAQDWIVSWMDRMHR
ncbi:hypothetical protein [Bifidobacterium sp. SO1]|uniref:hypothetical protein n=1 Tax=Bifidobacterium sp. SO1 TaxID=2809029 RepID=UPI001BDC55CA|nr:hypothetical protein [Bifidobacterium sp. SO1]MBT1162786.1 hypothetical protein [Bifidobacterium sp. SO1]